MIVLIVDTETTGLMPRGVPVTNLKAWEVCRLVQIAWEVYDYTDTDIRLMESRSFLVRPDGFDVPASAAAIHGVTTKRARAEGVPLADAMDALAQALEKADRIVAHNLAFDDAVVHSELLRLGWRDMVEVWLSKERACTMQMGTRRGEKWPRLAELYHRCFGKAPEGIMHTATADVSACAMIYWHLLATAQT